jgi:hypothetical protein
VVVGGLVAAAALGGDDDEDPDRREDAGGGGDDVPEVAVGGPVVAVPSEGIELQLPDGWVGADVSAGVDGVGTQLSPDDAAVAQAIDTAAAALPRIILLFGLDREAIGPATPFVENVNVLRDTSVPAGMDFDDMVRAQQRGLELVNADIEELEEIEGPTGPAVRVVYTLAGLPAESVTFITMSGGDTWVLTYGYQDADEADIAEAQASFQTFRVG